MFFMAFFIIPSTLDEQDLKNNVHSLIAAAKQVVIDHTQTQTGGSSSSNGQSTSKRYHNNNSNNDNMEAYVEQHGAIVINLASQQRRRSSLPVYDEKKLSCNEVLKADTETQDTVVDEDFVCVFADKE